MTKSLKIYSGRNRPDLTPVYRLFEQLTNTPTDIEKFYHWDVEGRVVDERADPQADVLLTNSQLALQLIKDSGVFEPCAARLPAIMRSGRERQIIRGYRFPPGREWP